jgi:hypothetical protein
MYKTIIQKIIGGNATRLLGSMKKVFLNLTPFKGQIRTGFFVDS